MNPPQQIFDFTAQLALLEAQSEQLRASELEVPEFPELPPFASETFEKLVLDLFPDKTKAQACVPLVRELGARHLFLLEKLPSPVFRHLLASQNPRAFFEFLGHKHFAELRKTLFRGFQTTPGQLKNPVILGRLQTYFCAHKTDLYILFLASRFDSEEQPQWAEELKTEAGRILLAARMGPLDAILFAVLKADFGGFSGYLKQLENPAEFTRAVSETAREIRQQAERETLEKATPHEPKPDSDAAQFWHARAQEMGATIEEARTAIQKANGWGKALEARNAELERAKKEIEKLKAAEKATTANWERRLQNAQKRADANLAELRQHDERESRKLQKALREKEELEAQLKTTQKQLRLAQQVLEDERKTILALRAQIEGPKPEPKIEAAPAPPPVKNTPPEPKTPLDDVFEWRADGRNWKLTPRQVKRWIDSNDEENLWQVQMALEVLEKSDREKYNRFFFRLKCEDPSYALVLTQPTRRVLVDASNVTRYQTNKHGRGILKNLLNMRDELRRLGCWPIILWADASLRHNVDEGKKFQEMLVCGEILQTDKGVEADEMLAREARNWGAIVVTNDARFFHKVSPDFEPPRITFRIFDGVVIVDDF